MLVECILIVICNFTLTVYYVYEWCALHNAVPMDLDVKMKAVMLGATFLIVSHCVLHIA